ncbi:MAG: AhpC/TSA family protein [Clostridiales bacterium]|nr:AhpC/TSA family protein [Clostridiales bacterium]
MSKKLKKGDWMPDFEVDTAYDQGIKISDLVKRQKKTIFWILRYVGCRVCRYDIHLLSQRYQEFLDKGCQVLVVMQSEPEVVRQDLEDAGIPFDMICDPKMEIYKELEIGSWTSITEEVRAKLKEKAAAASSCGFQHGKYEGNEEQLPAMFIVDDTRRVLYAHYAESIVDMPDISDVLKMDVL